MEKTVFSPSNEGASPLEKALIVEPEKCKGCSVCELICSSFHHGEYNPSKSYIKIFKNKDMCVFIPLLSVRCDLCNGEELCAKWCPEKVLSFLSWSEVAKQRRQLSMGRFPTPYFGE